MSTEQINKVMQQAAYEAMVKALTEDPKARQQIVEAGAAKAINEALRSLSKDNYTIRSQADQALREVALEVAREYVNDPERKRRLRGLVGAAVEKIVAEDVPRILVEALERGLGKRF